MTDAVRFTRAGMRRGLRQALPVSLGILPFGIVTGVVAQGAGLSLAETTLMSATVFAGASQLMALGSWAHPAPVLGATLAALVVNLRLALMGPALAPWLDRLRGWRVWLTLFFLVDHGWAMAITEIRAGRSDAGFLLGSGLALWLPWVVTSAAGHLLGSLLRPPPGHPLFFAALAAFISLLVPLWRGRQDLLPWAVAALVALLVARLLPGSYWHIVAGALAGSLTGALAERRGAA